MAKFAVLIAGLLLIAESQASDVAEAEPSTVQGFLSNYVTAPMQRTPTSIKGAANKDFVIIDDKEEEKAAQKLVTDGNNTHITLSAIGVGLLALVTMLGVRLQRGLRPATVLAGNVMELESQGSSVNGAASREWSPLNLLPSDPAAKMQPAVFAVEIKDAPYEGASNPFGFWDPLGLSELGSERTQAWFKAAETKHGRVAMAASTGWIVTELGFRWPGAYNMAGDKFADVPGGLAAEQVFRDNGGMVQILFSAGLVEFWSELQKPHYMSGGGQKQLPIWDPVGFTAGLSEEERKKKRLSETNNGRLAMIGCAGFWAATYIEGSVPALSGTAWFGS